ncbi:tetratricopeptide repeat protein [Loktanella sp. IMCC34160]|uniref:tetratricopeptide repeat protein n=1 Tax=Loktanella sp. IMCC34160 TaxID=2510646 RepID=UPI00101E02BD|nr:tetratricopeptide repeat protein [Loktanella sp. IMCC34160]RYG92322.1 tetratricopeptide repeat protein [Loktanella sp. IMCC34160]
MIDPLSKLAIRHGTDKFGYHDYTPNYHKLFQHLRDQPIRLLEIGVGGYQDADRGGQSLATWRDYFPNAEITGIDIQKKTLDLGPRVKILQGSQVDPEFLKQVVAERGPFDIIIDDGSHQNAHVVESFGYLWPDLTPGGIYVAEDVQTSFMPRFGGSLTLDHPNSVGYFGDVFLRMGHAAGDPLVAEVGAMERFHNIIALHKSTPGKVSTCAGSNLFDRIGAARKLATVGTKADPAIWGAAQTAKKPDGANVVVIGTEVQSEKTVFDAFEAMAVPGVLVLDGRIGPDHDLAEALMRTWVQVDHREMRIHFPEAEIPEVAKWVFSLEKHPDGVLFHKSLNDYPSNFAYDPEQEQAKAAIAAIEAELQDCDEENGLVQFAGMMTNLYGREAAAEWVRRLDRIEATSRIYYQLAGGLAQRERRFEDAATLFRKALAAFPADQQFTLGLCTVLLALGNTDEAADAVFEARETAPRNLPLMLMDARIKGRMGDHKGAIAIAQEAVEMSTGNRVPPAQIILAEALEADGQTDEARKVIAALATGPAGFAAKAYRLLSRIEAAEGNTLAAIAAADKALEGNPQSGEYKKWRGQLAAE